MHTLLKGPPATMVTDSEQPDVPLSYPRLRAPVYFTRVGVPFPFLFGRRKLTGLVLGGLRVYTDEKTKVGTRLELEVFLPDGTSVVCKTEVAWVESLPPALPPAATWDSASSPFIPTIAIASSAVLE